MTRVAGYGTWASPLRAADLVTEQVTLDQPCLDGDAAYWLECRPGEGGRVVLVRAAPDGTHQDLTPAPYNVRSRVHEYGGGAFAARGGLVVFVNFQDQRLYLIEPGTPPRPVAGAEQMRYGALCLDPARRLVYAVREDHRGAGEPVNELVVVDLEGDTIGEVLATGSDFVADPALNPGGNQLAWISWNHPNMPWDETLLHVARLDERGRFIDQAVVAGGVAEAAGEPRWSPSGRLFFLSDRSGFANLYRLGDDGPEPMAPAEREFGVPPFRLGTHTHDIADDGRIIASWFEDGAGRLSVIDPSSGVLTDLLPGVTSASAVSVSGHLALALVSWADRPAQLVRVDLSSGQHRVIASSGSASLPDSLLSRPELVTWQDRLARPVHGVYYPPRNDEFEAPDGELPPLIVMSHGGPTSMSPAAFDLGKQYWTTRGYAVLDVNYGGSSGFGRAYRKRLDGQWGVVDVADCAGGALAMADQHRADRARLAIRGGSAGGFTTLAALTFTDVFAAGASRYGISDLETLARDTHKFESRYCDGLVGPYPQAAQVYRQRSPIHHVDRLSAPLILLQGSDDAVVPPSQAQDMADALRDKGIATELVMFTGEGHGFRRAENIITALQREEAFYARVFGFDRAPA